MTIDFDAGGLAPLVKLDRDTRKLAGELSVPQVRGLVDMYYQIQNQRIELANQERAAITAGESHEVISHFGAQQQTLENQMRAALDAYSTGPVPGQWMRSVHGIGPVIAAGFLAHIDIVKAPTAGHIWRFAGLDPTVKWLGQKGARALLDHVDVIEADGLDSGVWPEDGYALTEDEIAELDEGLVEVRAELTREQLSLVARLTHRRIPNLLRIAKTDAGKITRQSMLKALSKRPWNARLKVLCWKAGDSFVKTSGSDKSFYGHIYAERKEYELERDARGGHADAAAQTLEDRNIRDKATRDIYESGRLPAGRLDLRARRYAVKLFLSHLQHVWYEHHFGEPPARPYILTVEGGHAHMIRPPHWPLEEAAA